MGLTGKLWRAWTRLRHREARRRAVREFRRSLALIVDREALEASVATRLKEIFDPDRLVILQLDPRAARYRLGFSSGFSGEDLADVELSTTGRLARWFTVNETGILLPRDHGVAQYLEPSERGLLERLKVQLCAPLLAQNHLTGMVFLGSSRTGRTLNRQDAELLQSLMDQASLAFQNATLYREQQDRLQRLHRADRLAAVGQLAAGVAHEVRNPLTAIRSTIQYLGQGFGESGTQHELVRELIDEVDRIDSTISGLLRLTRAAEFQPAEIDLSEVLEQTVRLMEIQARQQSVEIEERYHPRPLLLQADGSQLRQVFFNLIQNALQAMPKGGRIALQATLVRPTSGVREEPFIDVRVTDNGPGIPQEQLESVFDPFFTTKQEGTGLGLSICHNIIERHRGEMVLRSTEDEGTEVSILLPQRT